MVQIDTLRVLSEEALDIVRCHSTELNDYLKVPPEGQPIYQLKLRAGIQGKRNKFSFRDLTVLKALHSLKETGVKRHWLHLLSQHLGELDQDKQLNGKTNLNPLSIGFLSPTGYKPDDPEVFTIKIAFYLVEQYFVARTELHNEQEFIKSGWIHLSKVYERNGKELKEAKKLKIGPLEITRSALTKIEVNLNAIHVQVKRRIKLKGIVI